MKWLLKEPSYGDMIRIKLGEIYHYGVYAGDSEIIAFGKATDHNTPIPEDEVEVCTVGIDEFINGGFLEVAELDKRELKRRNPP